MGTFYSWQPKRANWGEFFSTLSSKFKTSVMIWAHGRKLFSNTGTLCLPEVYQIPPSLQGSLVPLPRTSLRTSFHLSPPFLSIYIHFSTTQLSTLALLFSYSFLYFCLCLKIFFQLQLAYTIILVSDAKI